MLSRRSKKININTLNSMRKVANACALLRFLVHKNEATFNNGELFLESSDVFLSILLNEETSLNKFGNDHVVFGGRVSKFWKENITEEILSRHP